MTWIVTKYLLTAGFIVALSELAKRSEKFGALVTALPLVTLATLVWLYLENQPLERIATYSRYTFWYVLPTLPMFLLIPALLPRWGFWGALLAGIVLTAAALAALAWLLRRSGIELL